jgi:hypothetical protein
MSTANKQSLASLMAYAEANEKRREVVMEEWKAHVNAKDDKAAAKAKAMIDVYDFFGLSFYELTQELRDEGNKPC